MRGATRLRRVPTAWNVTARYARGRNCCAVASIGLDRQTDRQTDKRRPPQTNKHRFVLLLYHLLYSWLKQYQNFRSCFISNYVFDTTLCLHYWPYDLDIRRTLYSHLCESYVFISPRSIANHSFVVYTCFAKLHVWPSPLILRPWPCVNVIFLSISIIQVIFIEIQISVRELKANICFLRIPCLTLTFTLWPWIRVN